MYGQSWCLLPPVLKKESNTITFPQLARRDFGRSYPHSVAFTNCFFYRLLEPKSAPKKRRVEEQQAPKEPLLPEAPSVSVPQTHLEVLLFPFPPLRTMARNKKKGLLPFGMGGKYSLFLSAGRGRVIPIKPRPRRTI